MFSQKKFFGIIHVAILSYNHLWSPLASSRDEKREKSKRKSSRQDDERLVTFIRSLMLSKVCIYCPDKGAGLFSQFM